jgi:hypothetical protein
MRNAGINANTTPIPRKFPVLKPERKTTSLLRRVQYVDDAGAYGRIFSNACRVRASRDAALFRRPHVNFLAVERNDLARANLARLAHFHLPVDGDIAHGDARFRRAAAVRETHQLEQVVEFDEVAREGELKWRHVAGEAEGSE